MKRINKWTWRFTLGFLVLVLIAVGLDICFTYMSDGRLEEIKADIQAQGSSLKLTDLVPQVPDEENSALLFDEAFALLEQRNKDEVLAQATLIQDLKNAKPEDLAVLKKWIEKNRECQALLEQGLTKPGCRHNMDYENPLECKLPSIMDYRDSVNLFNGQALLHAIQGRGKEAYTACLKGIRLGKSLNASPMIICYMIHIACEQSSLDCLEILLSHLTPPEQERQALVKELAAFTPFKSFQFALEGERCYGNTIFEILRGTCDDAVKEAGFMNPAWIPDFILTLDQVEYLKQVGKYIEQLNQPFPAANTVWKQGEALKDIPWYCTLTSCSLWENDLAVRNTGTLAAGVGFARIALELIKQEELPDTLEGLDLPLDPFSGAPFLYQKTPEGGFTVSSKGKEGDKELKWTFAPDS